MISTCLRSLAFSSVLLVVGSAFAEDVGVRSFPLPEYGVFQLPMPKSWRDRVSQTRGSTTPTIVLTPGSGEAFEVSLTPLWRTQPGTPLADPAEIKRKVEVAAEPAKQQSVEKELVIREIKGVSAVGYYFSATDRAPKPGEFKYMLQGIIRAGELLVLFTVLTHDGGDFIRRESIAMLESATYTNDEISSSARANTGHPDAIQITRTDAHYVLTVPLSRLVMEFPKGDFVLTDRDMGGETSNPRYFYFQGRESPLIISGWFASQQSYVGIQKFWADELASAKQRGLPQPQNVTFSKKGGWETIAFELTAPNFTDTHLRAHWVQAGTWIDLHLSLASRQPAREARERLVTLLGSMSVGEKN